MSDHVFRIDSFAVPGAVLADFTRAVKRTMTVLAGQPGLVRMQYFEQAAGPGRFNIVTLAEWASEAAQRAAVPVVQQAHADAGFDARQFVIDNGIEESKASYVEKAIA